MEVETEDVKPDIASTINIAGFSTIDEFTKAGNTAVVEGSKCTNAFPSGPTRSLYAACPTFSKIVEFQSNKILETIQYVLKRNHVRGNIQRRDNDEKFELLLECNDIMLERINTNLDELAGIQKKPVTELVQSDLHSVSKLSPNSVSGSWNNKNIDTRKSKEPRLLAAKNIQRPQVSFKTPVDNSNKTPFEPRLKYKPNSIKPLAVLPEYDQDGNIEGYLHPYETELNKFEVPPSQLKSDTPLKSKRLEETPLMYVDTKQQLKQLMETELVAVSELAVDLEHHSYRTFQGFTCLLQLSTREKDFIIDTLSLRDELHILNEVFTDPKILKVFHGADSDVEWLQRDLSIYVVNMFDTHQAAKRLGLPRLSLAFLIKHYCDFELDKTFQLADWRMRPLPEELILYARLDTHYLLYVWDCMKRDLLTLANERTNLLQSVFQSSVNICNKRYIKPRIHSHSYMEFYRKTGRIFDNRQLFALSAIFEWRDKIARQEDESYAYVLPNHMMLTIAEALPREMQGVLACCNPIPPLVKQNLNLLHQFILKAREQPLIKAPVEEHQTNRTVQSVFNKDSGFLFCPHDLSFHKEFRDDLPTLLNGQESNEDFSSKLIVSEKSSLSVFDTPENSDDEAAKEKLNRLKKIKFVSPYARYLAILPIAEQQRLEELKKQQEANKLKRLCPEKTESTEEYVLIKEERIDDPNDEYAGNLPLKDYGKRKPNDAVSNVQEQQPTAKRVKYETSTSEPRNKRSATNDQQYEHETKNEKKKKLNKLSHPNATTTAHNSQEFDYGQVDFKKFKGGSHQTKRNDNEVHTNFRGKNKHHGNNKKFNKLFTFSGMQNKGNKKK
ncbi:Exosome component 10 [Pseudolycoriella hygida]|uniref:Exosome complex component 10 homolog n=1 Tax=Pseudolycoriella hygida TaxID=35572 RepID=A0A9Q0MWL4_9DIPT|nr:Exosome component 10 [Pseudolycoriella hygida]